jgi:hypothetical protein
MFWFGKAKNIANKIEIECRAKKKKNRKRLQGMAGRSRRRCAAQGPGRNPIWRPRAGGSFTPPMGGGSSCAGWSTPKMGRPI